MFLGSVYLSFCGVTAVQLNFLLGDITDKVRIVVLCVLYLFVLIFVSLVIYVSVYFLINCFRTSSLSIYGDFSRNPNKILRSVRPVSLRLQL